MLSVPGCSGSVGFNPAIESVAMSVLPCFTCGGIDACIPVHVNLLSLAVRLHYVSSLVVVARG